MGWSVDAQGLAGRRRCRTRPRAGWSRSSSPKRSCARRWVRLATRRSSPSGAFDFAKRGAEDPQPPRAGSAVRQHVARARALTAATTGLVTDPALEGPFGFCHFAARPGDLLALDSFFIGKLKGVGPVWQLTAVDTATRWAIVEVFIGPSNTKIAARFLDRAIRKLRRLGVHVTGVLTDNGPEFSATVRPSPRPSSGSPITAPHPAPRTTTRSANGSKAPPPRVLASRVPPATLRPAHPTPRRDRQLARHLQHPPANHADFMRGRTPRQVLDTHPKKRAA